MEKIEQLESNHVTQVVLFSKVLANISATSGGQSYIWALTVRYNLDCSV